MSSGDKRFARLETDPRFRRPKQKNIKAEIDDRFKDVLSEDFGKGGKKAKVDSRGRKLTSTSTADEMKRFYRLKSPEEPEERVDYARGGGDLYSSGSEDESSDESEIEEEELELGGKRKPRLAPLSDSDESDSDVDSDDGDHLKVNLSEDEGMDTGEAEEDEGPGVDPTTRIAVVNLDWDNMRASDLFVLFHSFVKPPPRKGEALAADVGKLVSVRIYTSQFGKERMKDEDEMGPGGGIFKRKEGEVKKNGKKRGQELTLVRSDDENEDEDNESEDDAMSAGSDEVASDDEDMESNASSNDPIEEIDLTNLDGDDASEAGSDDIDMDALRQYQLDRLRYYYAIATFTTIAAAQRVHDELNGTEFERTANVLDLSYVPEGMSFDEDEPADQATKEPKAYKGKDYVTDALRHSKVKLTWDQDDPDRIKLTRRALTREEIEEENFDGLVAGSDSEVDEEEAGEEEGSTEAEAKKTKKQKMKERTEKLRALLLSGDDDNGDIWGKAGQAWQSELADIKEDAAERDGKKGKGTKGKAGKPKEDLEITFTPGLSVSAAAAADNDNMTSLDKYKARMKEKKSRKKEMMELKRAEREDGESGKKGKSDEFFGDDSDMGSDGDDAIDAKSKLDASSKSKSKSKANGRPKTEDKFEAFDADDPAGLVADQSHHFSLKDHLAAEKLGADGKKRKRYRKKKAADGGEVELGPEGFKVDVADPRFSAMYNEAAFALDPTHSKFTETSANREILKRTREKHAAKRESQAAAASGVKSADSEPAGEERGLSDLVANAKRRAEGAKSRPRKRSRK